MALLTVALVCGQATGSLGVDWAGLSPAGKRPVTGYRLLGVGLAVTAVVLGALEAGGDIRPGLLGLAVLAGVGVSFQQAAMGHVAIGLEGAPRFAAMARAYSGCEVWEQDFLRLELPENRFDGVFANASLFHVPRQELPRVLGELKIALVSGGILFSSNPRGNEEGWTGPRFGNFMEFDVYAKLLEDAGSPLLVVRTTVHDSGGHPRTRTGPGGGYQSRDPFAAPPGRGSLGETEVRCAPFTLDRPRDEGQCRCLREELGQVAAEMRGALKG